MLFNYKKNRVWAENAHIITYIGLTMAGSILFCFYIGHLIDKWLGIKGIFTIIFTIIGVIGGAYTVYRQIMEITDKAAEEKNNNNGND